MILYIIKSGLCLAILLGVYHLLLEKEITYRFNRFYLLGALIFGLIVPLIHIEAGSVQTLESLNLTPGSESLLSLNGPVIETQGSRTESIELLNRANQGETGISFTHLLFACYLLVVSLLMLRLLVGAWKLIALKKNNAVIQLEKASLVLISAPIPPHAFFNTIYVYKEDYKSGRVTRDILEHELTHVRQLHSIDIIFIEVLKAIFWFNPVFYYFKRAIQLNHEFTADQNALKTSGSKKIYLDRLFKFFKRRPEYQLASTINFSLTKKRLVMIKKSNISYTKVSLLKQSIILPLACILFLSFCTTDYSYTETGANKEQMALAGSNSDLRLSVDLNIKRVEDQNGKTAVKYYLNGQPYTGERFAHDRSTGELVSRSVYKDGELELFERYYQNDKLFGTYDWSSISTEDVEAGRNRANSITYYTSGQKKSAFINPSDDGSTLGTYREWYENGQLKFNMFLDENYNYEGLMTLYSESGIILKQEQYDDGVLVE